MGRHAPAVPKYAYLPCSSRSRRSARTPSFADRRRALPPLAHPLDSGFRRVAQSIERLGVNVAFVAREGVLARRRPLGCSTVTRALPRDDVLRTPRVRSLLTVARDTRGFMPDDEGEALVARGPACGRAWQARGKPAVLVEVGVWCGKSTIYLGVWPRPPVPCCSPSTTTVAPRRTNRDGSTTSPTWSTPMSAGSTRWPHWRREHRDGRSGVLRRRCRRRLADDGFAAGTGLSAFCFIDGGHGHPSPLWADFRGWSPLVADGGWLAIHDVFPRSGGRRAAAFRARPCGARLWDSSPTTAPAEACASCDGLLRRAERNPSGAQAASEVTWAGGVLGVWEPVSRITSASPAATASTASMSVPMASTARLPGLRATKNAAAAHQTSERCGARWAARSSRKKRTLLARR